MLVRTIQNPALIAAAILAPLTIPAAADALDCPNPQRWAQPGVIQETAEDIAAFSSIFADGALDAVPKAIAVVRKRYPNAQSAEIANYLITAYCPAVQKLPHLNEAEKTARMKAFADRVLRFLY
jgi:hypothetical protein